MVELLRIQLDDRLKVNFISNICSPAANRLNALIRLSILLNFKARKLLINSYVVSNFNYCPLVWMFSNPKSLNKVEGVHERAIRFFIQVLYVPLWKVNLQSGQIAINLNRMRALYWNLENIKTNPAFMNEFLSLEIIS